jgi:hypothetical protein
LLLPVALHAQILSTPNPNEPQRIKVSGKVVNSVSGEPLSRALVTISGRESRNMLTDYEGSFVFEGVISDGLVFNVRKPGFFDPSQGKVVPPTKAENLVLKLAPAAVITGRVLGTNEEPVEGAQVQLHGQANVEGRKRWVQSNSTRTDEDGRFRLPNLQPGSYVLEVSPLQSRGIPGETSYAAVYFPNAPDRRSASTIRLSPGQQMEVNFNVTPVAAFNLTGRIVGPQVEYARVEVTDLSGTQVGVLAGVNMRTSMFQIRGLARGTYVIHAMGVQSGRQLSGRTTVTVTSERNDLIVALQPSIDIPIVIRREDLVGSTAPQQFQPNIAIRAVSLDNEQQQAYSTYDGPPEQGHLVLKGVDTGRYRLTISSYGEYYVASASLAGTNLLTDPLVVGSSGVNDPIEVVLRNDGASIRITTRDSTGRAAIIALPDRGENPQPVMGNCMPDGRCFLPPAIAPGSYTIYAFDRLDDVEYANRKALENYSSKAAHVTLSPKQTQDVTLDVIQTEP